MISSFPVWCQSSLAAHCMRPTFRSSRRGHTLLTPVVSLWGCFLSAQESAIPALTSTPSLLLPLHFTSISHPYFLSLSSLPNKLLYRCCCQPCPFTFLPSAAVSFCITIVPCEEKAKKGNQDSIFCTSIPPALFYFSRAAFAANPSFLLAVCCRTEDLIFSGQCITGRDLDFACGL